MQITVEERALIIEALVEYSQKLFHLASGRKEEECHTLRERSAVAKELAHRFGEDLA